MIAVPIPPPIQPSVPPIVTLQEARAWVGLAAREDDAALARLVAVASELAERFVGEALVARDVVDRVPTSGWRTLALRPVRAVTAVAAVEPDGLRLLAPGQWIADILPDGVAQVRVLDAYGARSVEIAYRAGRAEAADELPDSIRHGALRLAAELYRDRDAAEASFRPSAAVAALWQPHRRMTLNGRRAA